MNEKRRTSLIRFLIFSRVFLFWFFSRVCSNLRRNRCQINVLRYCRRFAQWFTMASMCGFSSDTIKFRVEFSAFSNLHFSMQMRLSASVRGDKEFLWPRRNANFYTWPSSFGYLIDVSWTFRSLAARLWLEWMDDNECFCVWFGNKINIHEFRMVSRGDLRVDLEDGGNIAIGTWKKLLRIR